MDTKKGRDDSAARVVASTLGILVGLAGIEHGIFEILQGNVTTEGVMIDAIGPAQRFWEYGVETALTIVPSFLVTGVLAVVLGLMVTVWSWKYIARKRGAWVLLALSILLWLVGGGFAPIFMAIPASLTAARINNRLTWPVKVLPVGLLNFLTKIWLGSLILFVVMFVISVEIIIFGWPLTSFMDAESSFNLLNTFSLIMLIPMLIAILAGLAYDSQERMALRPV